MGRVRGAVNARALSLARKAVDLCNCWRREAAAECLVEKQVELVSFGEDPIMVVSLLYVVGQARHREREILF